MYETASVMFTSLGRNIAWRRLFDMKVETRQLPGNSFLNVVAFKDNMLGYGRIVALIVTTSLKFKRALFERNSFKAASFVVALNSSER